jgi:Holliday junction resolvase
MTNEAKVKKKVVEMLKEVGAYYFFPVTGGYGRSGVPDIICCIKGNFVGIECKTRGNKPTALQQKNIDEIRSTGGYAFVVDEDGFRNLKEFLNEIGRT